jgi:hypothetical protein
LLVVRILFQPHRRGANSALRRQRGLAAGLYTLAAGTLVCQPRAETAANTRKPLMWLEIHTFIKQAVLKYKSLYFGLKLFREHADDGKFSHQNFVFSKTHNPRRRLWLIINFGVIFN